MKKNKTKSRAPEPDEKANILLVDDKSESLLALEAVLASLDQRLIKARSGQEALKFILKYDIAVVLLDVTMPGMSGFETASLIRARDKSRHIPIIFVTGINFQETHVIRGYSLGGVDYILKPLVPEILRGKVGVFVELFKKTGKINQQSRLLEKKNRDLRREIKERKRVERELWGLNKTLEQRVAERTEAVETHAKKLARSNAELEEFAYMASHDLQEPLRKVVRFAQLLEQALAKSMTPEIKEYLFYLVDGATRMKTLIQDLLKYSQTGWGELGARPVNIQDLITQILSEIEPAIQECSARVRFRSLPSVYANLTLLRQLFQNLILNAIKFRRKGAPSIDIAAKKEGDVHVFSVRDDGIGIEPQNLEKIFKIFQRLHSRDEYPGSGIGLAICKKIVERHGGKMWVESEVGIGSVFYFTLPGQNEEAPESPETQAPESAELQAINAKGGQRD